MPTQRTRRTSPARSTGPAPDTSGDAPSTRSAAGARPAEPRWSRCRTCRHMFVAASLVAGDCPGCAGLVALPLRGEGGKFLPGLSHGPTPSPSRPIAPSRTRDDVR